MRRNSCAPSGPKRGREREREGQRPNFFKQNEGEPVFSLNLPDKREGKKIIERGESDVGKKEIRVIRKSVSIEGR